MAARWTFQTLIRSRLFLFGGTALALLIAVSAGREFYANWTMEREINALEDEAKRLESRRLELLELAKRLESGDFLEEQARLELGLQLPGETVAVVRTGEVVAAAPERQAPQSNPARWWSYFVHRN